MNTTRGMSDAQRAIELQICSDTATSTAGDTFRQEYLDSFSQMIYRHYFPVRSALGCGNTLIGNIPSTQEPEA
ncbi:uncharacterized protein QC761_0019840 [Podospora bellae-mahoneyi]|uniref:Uncharacterized protein n=1 Tax=Podospora bellae-mahoneyi TaxID=2093777 RepID=A0ABR0G0P8_9PEZI|nr:hypothetical protein QC761_0019840 [Podospora bellae-mahoneyi]